MPALPLANVAFQRRASKALVWKEFYPLTCRQAPSGQMPSEHTQLQTSGERTHAKELSEARTKPPRQVPGYRFIRFLGAGAYGEVWVAEEQNTGRQVAVKFFLHQGGLDWSLLSREVQKLVLLAADRYVVQLLDVGRDVDPPYYVMEYFQHGSLEDRIRREGPLPINEAVSLFHETVLGLAHAHDKGVLHCDLKPANILLDQDSRPRLADFGQSRLSHEQSPSLGTLFYMAPEQADLNAVPEASWDVYGLGAVLHCLLLGEPPRRSDDAIEAIETADSLDERLIRYRTVMEESPPLTAHRRLRGLDQPLRDILEKCLATEPRLRYPNVQAVLDALENRARWYAMRPLVVLGAIGPAILLVVMAVFAWKGFSTTVGQSDEALTRQALKSNRFAAQSVAKVAAHELERRFHAVERLATDSEVVALMVEVTNNPILGDLREILREPDLNRSELEVLREEFRGAPGIQRLQSLVQRKVSELEDESLEISEPAASWFVTDNQGLQIARTPEAETIGEYFGWRTYFHGGRRDLEELWKNGSWSPSMDDHISSTRLSAVFPSQATNRWIVAISSPVHGPQDRFLGVVALTIEVGQMAVLEGSDEDSDEQFAVLVDWREGEHKGQILQHPIFDWYAQRNAGELPRSFADNIADFILHTDELPSADNLGRRINYIDPISRHPAGETFSRRWLAEMDAVTLRDGRDTGWRVIVQQSYQSAIGGTLTELQRGLWITGSAAVIAIGAVITALWWFVIRVLKQGPSPIRSRRAEVEPSVQPSGDTVTQAAPR